MLRVWALETGALIFSAKEHAAAINDCCFGSTGTTLVTASDDGTLGLWDMERGRVADFVEGGAGCVARLGSNHIAFHRPCALLLRELGCMGIFSMGSRACLPYWHLHVGQPGSSSHTLSL